MNPIDLHIHTKFSSDGEFTPEEIVSMASGIGLKTIAVTDHNSVGGIAEAVNAGQRLGINVIPAIEIDCRFKEIDLHLLGYRIDYSGSRFDELEGNVFRQESTANRERIEKLLRNTDLKLDIDSFLAKSGNRIITGEMIAEELMTLPENSRSEYLIPYLPGGQRSDSPFVNFYWDYFSQGKIAHVPIDFISYHEAVRLVKNAGGIPVIAHAGVNLRHCPERATDLIDAGAEGLEIYNTYHTLEQSLYLRHLAEERRLVMTCGSDFHGKTKPNVKLGVFPMESAEGLGI
ncbi:MAG TPA: phosphatase [Planctomycetaceae bacterium]|nr:phosphatase [Planctomycetaceae bacterium]